jgi:hypothetical protein
MLSNLSDLLMSRVDPDPVKAQTAMVGMSPQSQAQAMQQAPAQQQVAAPQQAQFLNTTAQGKPGKTPQNVLDYLKLMEEGGIETPPGEVPAHLLEGNQQEQGGKPTKKLNLSGVKVTTADLEGDAGNPYQKLLKGKYGTKEVNSLTGKYETEEDSYRRMLMGHNIGGERLDRALYIKERMMDFNSKLPDSLSRKQKETKATEYLNKIQKEGPVAW